MTRRKATKKKQKRHKEMAISQDTLKSIIGRASALCSPQGDTMISSYSTDKAVLNGTYDEDDGWSDPIISNGGGNLTKRMSKQELNNDYSDAAVMKSNLPDAIKESLLNKKIKKAKAPNDLSYLTEGIEQAQPQAAQQIPTVNAASPQVDYSIIKAIINECLKDYFKENPITNNNPKSIAYSESTNKIRVIRENGDIYGGKLTFQGNVNDKK